MEVFGAKFRALNAVRCTLYNYYIIPVKLLAIGNNWLGDVVMSLPSIYALKRDLNYNISILTKSYVKQVYTLFNWVDHIYITEEKREWPINDEFDSLVIFPRSLSSLYLSMSFKAKTRIGYSGFLRSFFLDRCIKRTHSIAYKSHRTSYYYEIARQLGASDSTTLPPINNFEPSKNWDEHNGSVILCPGAKYGDAKMWLPEGFIKLGRLIASEHNSKIAVIGTASEHEICSHISNSIPGSYDLSGKTTIHDLISLFKISSLLITNDTGAMHLASLTSIPIITIFGPTNPYVTSSSRKENCVIVKEDMECSPCLQRSCPLKHHNCMKKITASSVYELAKKFLN